MEMVSKPCQYPILVHSMIEKKENTGSQMGHTKTIYKENNYENSIKNNNNKRK